MWFCSQFFVLGSLSLSVIWLACLARRHNWAAIGVTHLHLLLKGCDHAKPKLMIYKGTKGKLIQDWENLYTVIVLWNGAISCDHGFLYFKVKFAMSVTWNKVFGVPTYDRWLLWRWPQKIFSHARFNIYPCLDKSQWWCLSFANSSLSSTSWLLTIFAYSLSAFQASSHIKRWPRGKSWRRENVLTPPSHIKTFLDDFKRFKYELTYSATEQDSWIQGAWKLMFWKRYVEAYCCYHDKSSNVNNQSK